MDGARDCTVIGEITLPGVRRSVGCARRFVRGVIPGFPGLDDVIVVTSETVANAITHTASGSADGLVTVAVAVVEGAGGGVYRLEVADQGAAGGHPHVRDEPGAETGRGMRIVAALASRWGYREEGTGTVVWAEFPAPAADGPGRGRGTPLSGPG